MSPNSTSTAGDDDEVRMEINTTPAMPAIEGRAGGRHDRNRAHRVPAWIWSWLILAIIIAAWEASTRALSLSALVLPAPSAVLRALWNGLVSGFLWPHIAATLTELALGTLLGCAIGFTAGVAMAESPRLRDVLMPYVVVSQVVPKLALAPLFILWFGFGMTSTVVITALICFFPLLENTMLALTHVPPERLELFRMLDATRLQTFLKLKLPTGLPAILAGVRVAIVLALVGAVVGEFIGANRGLGALVIAAQGSMDTAQMFAVLTLIALIGMAAYRAVLAIEHRLLVPYLGNHR